MRAVQVTTIAVRAAGLLSIVGLGIVPVKSLDQYHFVITGGWMRPVTFGSAFRFICDRSPTTRGVLWWVLMLLSVYALLDGRLVVRLLLRGLREGVCQHCGYDVSGLRSARCPECGEATGHPQRQSDRTSKLNVVSSRYLAGGT